MHHIHADIASHWLEEAGAEEETAEEDDEEELGDKDDMNADEGEGEGTGLWIKTFTDPYYEEEEGTLDFNNSLKLF